MKIVIKKIFRAIGSRMTYLLIGLSFSVVVIAANAAMPALNTTTTVSSANTLTSGMWNGMVTDLGNIKTAVDGMSPGFTTCMTKSASMTSCVGEMCSGTVECDAGWTMTGGGCLVSQYDEWELMRQSHPSGNGWRCGQTYDTRPGTAYARCCR